MTQALLMPNEVKAKRRADSKRHNASPAGRRATKKYQQSEKFRQVRARYWLRVRHIVLARRKAAYAALAG